MNNRIEKAFENRKAFIPFITAGDPDAETCVGLIRAMTEVGADLIELGIPFSDPIADGPVIQEANLRALRAGITTDCVFEIVREARKFTEVPIVLLTYLNPVFCYGYERFMKMCAETGVDGVIIPDMPFEEKGEIADIADRYGIAIISLIAPTSAKRIRMIAEKSQGFIYVVSSLGVTGVRKEITADLDAMQREIRAVSNTPTAVGFGIYSTEQASEMSRSVDGIIVGSAIVRLIEQYGRESAPHVAEYVKKMKDSMNR